MEEKLKEKLTQKIEDEYKEFISILKTKTPEEIIQRSYEKVTKEEITYLFNKDYSKTELKALLKRDCLLDECYDNWLKCDGNFNEMIEYSVDDVVDNIVNDYKRDLKAKSKDSR